MSTSDRSESPDAQMLREEFQLTSHGDGSESPDAQILREALAQRANAGEPISLKAGGLCPSEYHATDIVKPTPLRRNIVTNDRGVDGPSAHITFVGGEDMSPPGKRQAVESVTVVMGVLHVEGQIAVQRDTTGQNLEKCLKNGIGPNLMSLDVLLEWGVYVRIIKYSKMRGGEHSRTTFGLICKGATAYMQHEVTGAVGVATGHFPNGARERAILERGLKELAKGVDFLVKPVENTGLRDFGVDITLALPSKRVVLLQVTMIANLSNKPLTEFLGRCTVIRRKNEHVVDDWGKDERDLDWPGLNGIVIISDQTVCSQGLRDSLKKQGVWVLVFKFPHYPGHPSRSRRTHGIMQTRMEEFPKDEDLKQAYDDYNRIKPDGPFKPRPRQEEAANQLYKNYQRLNLLESPMGTGKSIMLALIFVDFFRRNRRDDIFDANGMPMRGDARSNKFKFKPKDYPFPFFFFFPTVQLCNHFLDMLDKLGFLQKAFGELVYDAENTSANNNPADFILKTNCTGDHKIDCAYIRQQYNAGKRAFALINGKAGEVLEFMEETPSAVAKDEAHCNAYDAKEYDRFRASQSLIGEKFTAFVKSGKATMAQIDARRAKDEERQQLLIEEFNQKKKAQPGGEFISKSTEAVLRAGQSNKNVFGLLVTATPIQVLKNLPDVHTVYKCTEDEAILAGEMCNHKWYFMSVEDKIPDEGNAGDASTTSPLLAKMFAKGFRDRKAAAAVMSIDLLQLEYKHFLYIPCGSRIEHITDMEDRFNEAFRSRDIVPGFENVKYKFYRVHQRQTGERNCDYSQTRKEALGNIDAFKAAQKTEFDDKTNTKWILWHIIMDCGMMEVGVDIPNCDIVVHGSLPDKPGQDTVEGLLQEFGRSSRVCAGKKEAIRGVPAPIEHPVCLDLIQHAYKNESQTTPTEISSRLNVRTLGGDGWDTSLDAPPRDHMTSIELRQKFNHANHAQTRKQILELATAPPKPPEPSKTPEQIAKEETEKKLKGMRLDAAPTPRQICNCFPRMLLGLDYVKPRPCDDGKAVKACCTSWIKYRDAQRAKPPADKDKPTFDSLPPDTAEAQWRKRLVDPEVEVLTNLDLEEDELWIAVGFLQLKGKDAAAKVPGRPGLSRIRNSGANAPCQPCRDDSLKPNAKANLEKNRDKSRYRPGQATRARLAREAAAAAAGAGSSTDPLPPAPPSDPMSDE